MRACVISVRESVRCSGERNESCSRLGCMELRCHGHSADNWPHSSSCRLNTIKPYNKHFVKAAQIVSINIVKFFDLNVKLLNNCHFDFFK